MPSFLIREEQIESLYRLYYPRLRAYAVRFVDESTAEDLIQDSFVRLWNKRKTLRTDALSSMLFVMLRNACLNHLKSAVVSRHEPMDSHLAHNGEERLYNWDFSFSGEDEYLFDELRRQVDTVMDSLPPKCREVFIMSRVEGLKNREIAERLHTSVTNVEKHITKALSVFSSYFKDKYPLDICIAIMAWLSLTK